MNSFKSIRLKFAFLFLTMGFGLTLSTFAQDSASVLSYHNVVVDHHSLVVAKANDFFDQMDQVNFEEAYVELKGLNKQARKSLKELSTRGNPTGTEKLKQSAILLFIFYRDISEQELQSFFRMAKKGSEITEEDKLELIMVYERVFAMEKIFDEKLRTAQEELSQQFDFSLRR